MTDILVDRILEISKKYGLSHVGSNISAVGILDEIFPLGEVIVSSGHAGLAYFVVREKYLGEDAEELLKLHGIHVPMYGSLGHGLPIALGMALATNENIYCLISDGECMEGSIYETLRLAKTLDAQNLKIYVNANGYGGMESINRHDLEKQLYSFGFPLNFIWTNTYPLFGLEAHYEKVI